MSNHVTFGKYEGQTMEWILFNAPWYAEYIYDHRIDEQPQKFDEEAGMHFRELFTRASLLKGQCRWCKQAQITRMGLTSFLSGAQSSVSFYCNGCEPKEQNVTEFDPPSFFTEAKKISWPMHRKITEYIKNRYIGKDVRLTQAKMEEFFRNDANFVDATPGFFVKQPAMAG